MEADELELVSKVVVEADLSVHCKTY